MQIIIHPDSLHTCHEAVLEDGVLCSLIRLSKGDYWIHNFALWTVSPARSNPTLKTNLDMKFPSLDHIGLI